MLPGPHDKGLSLSLQVLEHWGQLLRQPGQGSEQLRYLLLETVSEGRNGRMIKFLEQFNGRFQGGLCLCQRNEVIGWRDRFQGQAYLAQQPGPMVEQFNGPGFHSLGLGQRHLDLEASATAPNEATPLQISPTGAFGVLNGLVGPSFQSPGEVMGLLQEVK